MSNSANTPLSEKTRRKHALWLQYLLILVGMLVLGFVSGAAVGYLDGVLEDKPDAPPWMSALRDGLTNPLLYAALIFGALIWATLWGVAYWRQLDELARAAHERAWFWGGSLAMGLGLAGVMAAAVVPPFCNMTFPGFSPMELIAAGAIGITCVMLLGYAIAWAIFWWRAR